MAMNEEDVFNEGKVGMEEREKKERERFLKDFEREAVRPVLHAAERKLREAEEAARPALKKVEKAVNPALKEAAKGFRKLRKKLRS